MAHANHTVIELGGAPAFVVVPYADYLDLTNVAPAKAAKLITKAQKAKPAIPSDDSVPHEVVRATIKHDCSMIRAWREHLGFTQAQMAAGMGIGQSTYAEMEAPDANPRKSTRERIAAILDVSLAQLS